MKLDCVITADGRSGEEAGDSRFWGFGEFSNAGIGAHWMA